MTNWKCELKPMIKINQDMDARREIYQVHQIHRILGINRLLCPQEHHPFLLQRWCKQGGSRPAIHPEIPMCQQPV